MMKGLNGYKKGSGSRDRDSGLFSKSEAPVKSLNLAGISNFNLVTPQFSNPASSSSSHPALRWNEHQVLCWLADRGLGDYETQFLENDINGEVLLELNLSLLKMMGINTVGARVRILEAVKELKREHFASFKTLSAQKSEGLMSSSPLSGLSAFLKPNKSHTFYQPSPEIKQAFNTKKAFHSSFGPSPPISPEVNFKETNDIMTYGVVNQNCVRVYGDSNEYRIVNLFNAHDPQTIWSKILAKFNIEEEQSKYGIFVASEDKTARLSDDDLVIICTSANRPERERLYLRKMHSPTGHNDLKRHCVQRMPFLDPLPMVESSSPGANSKQNKLTKIFGTRPPSELISSNLERFFPAQEEEDEPAPTVESAALKAALASLNSQRPRAPKTITPRSPSTTTSANSMTPVSDGSMTHSPVSVPLDCSNKNSPMFDYDSEATTTTTDGVVPGTIKWQRGPLIGAGSFGEVFLGLNKVTGEVMAVKQVALLKTYSDDKCNSSERRKSEKRLEALRQEIGLLKNLKHPNIVQYIGSQVDETHLNILLEYVSGGSITGMLAQYGPFNEDILKIYVRQILQGLIFLHSKNIVHRDIKGGNILIDAKGHAKISDFGISQQIQEEVLAAVTNQRFSLQGSIFWMAPEVVKETYYSHKADIWGLGCLVIEMMTGTHPFPRITELQAVFRLGTMNAPEIPENISPAGRRFLEQTFKVDFNQRPNADKLLEHEFLREDTS